MKERQRWQPEEDALLRAYVKQYGPREWHLVSHRMNKPLDRDAKSCLERWKNYLKPGIKKGSLTQEEQALVISLQAKYGNKWKKIASEVPGRTAKRLGKWWEVFKEKQLKQQQSKRHSIISSSAVTPPPPPPLPNSPSSIPIVVAADQSSATTTVQSKYDHILETFAEKYVQPKLKMLIPTNLAPPATPPTLCLGTSSTKSTISIDPNPIPMPSSSSLPPWLSSASSSTATSTSCSSSPSVSLSLSPSEPGLDSVQPAAGAQQQQHQERVLGRFFPVGTQLVQYCKELEEVRMNWVQHKKEATWRLSRLEQQLESEKARKRREKMEEVEAKIRGLREEERIYMDRIESECREQLSAIQRDADAKETKMVESWAAKHVRLTKLVEQMGLQQQHLHFKELHGRG